MRQEDTEITERVEVHRHRRVGEAIGVYEFDDSVALIALGNNFTNSKLTNKIITCVIHK